MPDVMRLKKEITTILKKSRNQYYISMWRLIEDRVIIDEFTQSEGILLLFQDPIVWRLLKSLLKYNQLEEIHITEGTSDLDNIRACIYEFYDSELILEAKSNFAIVIEKQLSQNLKVVYFNLQNCK